MNIADLRKAAGITQQQLASISGIAQQNISRLERGERSIENLSLLTASKLAKALGVHAEDLLETDA